MKRLVVDLKKTAANLRLARELAYPAAVIPVLKANAYGLGIDKICGLCADEGFDTVAVAMLEEAETLRGSGYKGGILLLSGSGVGEDAEKMISLSLICSVGSVSDVESLEAAAEKLGVDISVHIKVDTGMGRYGFFPEDGGKTADIIKKCHHLHVEGVYTHLSRAFSKPEYSRLQFERFDSFCEGLRLGGIFPKMRHICASIGCVRYPEYKLDAVRIGSLYTGRLSFPCAGLQRVGYFETDIKEIRELRAGDTIGYGAIYKAKRPTKVAVLACGWGDGLFTQKVNDTFRLIDILRNMYHDFRQLFGYQRTCGYIGGKKALTVGRIGPTSVKLDVTGIECGVGDIVRFEVNPMFISPSVERHYI